MGISMQSASRLVLATLSLAGSTAPAQETVQRASQENARETVAAHGAWALERLKDAQIAAPDDLRAAPHALPMQTPVLPDTKRPAVERRAFDALRNRAVPEAIETRAREAQARGAAALAQERARQARALRQALGLEPSEEQAIAKAGPNLPADTATRWVPVIFVSSSMPIAVLRSYAGQLERVHGVLAFRGMPGGLRKAGPMAELTARILRRNPGCEGPGCAMRDVQVIVDPLVFRQHAIARVPALAMIPGDPAQAYCERDDDSPRAAHLVYGDSALPGLLEEYARLGGKEDVRHAQALMGDR